MKVTYTCLALLCALMAGAQSPKFSVEVSSDTLLLGNYFELKFTIENAGHQQFEPPDLSAFHLLSGPNTSTSMSIVNGKVSQSASFAYYLEPRDIGNYTIPPAYVTIGDSVLETPPIDIIVVPNPDGIIQRPHGPGKRFDQLFPDAPKPSAKPKRPRKKI